MTSERPPDFIELPVKMSEVDRRRLEDIAFLLATPDNPRSGATNCAIEV
jgi:hypothetical protein